MLLEHVVRSVLDATFGALLLFSEGFEDSLQFLLVFGENVDSVALGSLFARICLLDFVISN